MKRHGILLAGLDRFTLALADSQRLACDGLARCFARLLFPHNRFVECDRIVVYRVGNIGDTITAVPALNALRARYPDARITLLTSPGDRSAPGAAELLVGHPALDEICIYYADELRTKAGRRRVMRFVQDLEPRLFVDLSPVLQPLRTALRTIAFARLAGARSFVGGRVSITGWFHRTQARRRSLTYDARRLLRLLRPLGIRSLPGPLRFGLPRPPDAEREASAFLRSAFPQRAGNRADEPLVLLNPGAKRPANRWPAERYAAAGVDLVRRYGARLVILGSEGERELAERVAERIRTEVGDWHCAIAAGAVDVTTSVALIRRARLLVTNDTGSMHVASAVGSLRLSRSPLATSRASGTPRAT